MAQFIPDPQVQNADQIQQQKNPAVLFMQDGEETSLVLIYGDKVETMAGAAFIVTPNNTKKLSGIINVRSNGKELYAARRVTASYQWESYDPIDVTEFG